MSDPVLEFPFSGGFDESTREEILEPGRSFTALQNGRQNTYGGYSKRLGYEGLGAVRLDATSRTDGRRLLTNGDQLCTIDGAHLDVYSETLSRSVVRSRVPEAIVSIREAPTAGFFSYLEDVVYVNGYVVSSYGVYDEIGTQNLHVTSVVDEANGTVVRAPEYIDVGTITMLDTRLAAYGVYAIAFSCHPATNEIRSFYLNTTSAATIAAGWQTLATFTDYANGVGFDCSNMASNDRVAIAFGAASNAGARLTVKTLTIAGALESVDVDTVSTLDNLNGIALSEGASTLWVAWTDGQDLKVRGLNPVDIDGTALATTLTVTTLGASYLPSNVYICQREASGDATVYAMAYDSTIAAANGWIAFARDIRTSAGAAATDGSLFTIGSAFMSSRPFLRGDRIYAQFDSYAGAREMILCDATLPSSGVVLFRPVAVAVQRDLVAPTQYARCRSSVVDASRYVTGLTIRQSGETHGARFAVYDFGSPYRWRPISLNGDTCIGGGVTTTFDGQRVAEMGFVMAPRTPQVDDTSGTGQTFTYGRRYVATFQQVDTDGRWHVSGVSTACDISGPCTNKQVVVYGNPCVLTARDDSGSNGATPTIRVVFYATLDENDGEEPYYRVGAAPNDPTNSYCGIIDTLDDDELRTQALLYGTGNLPATGAGQDHRAPAGLPHIVSYNGMLVGASGTLVTCSSQPIDGEGQWFSPLFDKAIDANATGIAVQDGTVIIFTERGAWAVAGEPPSDNAFQGGLGTPRKLAVDHGCINANSVLATGIGTFYQSSRGLEILTRGLTNAFIGAPVQDTLAAFPVITSAVLDTNEGLARFSLAEAQVDSVVSGDGRDLVYDMVLGVWVSSDLKRGDTPAEASQDACMAFAAGAWRYCWLGANGTVYHEKPVDDEAANRDGETFVQMKAVTPWVHIAGIQGEQFIDQLLFLAKRHTAHQIAIALAFDYSDTFGTPKTFTADQIDALAREWLVKEVEQTTSQAVRAMIYDTVPTGDSPTLGTGAGSTWVALTFNGQPHRGPKRSSGAQRGGT